MGDRGTGVPGETRMGESEKERSILPYLETSVGVHRHRSAWIAVGKAKGKEKRNKRKVGKRAEWTNVKKEKGK